MQHWKCILQNYIIRYSNQIKKATEPLEHHFDISYFIYYRIDNVGHYTGLANRPDWIEQKKTKKIQQRRQDSFCFFLLSPHVSYFALALIDKDTYVS